MHFLFYLVKARDLFPVRKGPVDGPVSLPSFLMSASSWEEGGKTRVRRVWGGGGKTLVAFRVVPNLALVRPDRGPQTLDWAGKRGGSGRKWLREWKQQRARLHCKQELDPEQG